jgi:hypothetical protein
VNFGPPIIVLEYIKPVFQVISFVLLVVSGIIAAKTAHTVGLLLLCVACFLTAITVASYFTMDLQLQWKVIALPVEVRGLVFFLGELLYLIEVFLWPAAVITIARERRASSTPTV